MRYPGATTRLPIRVHEDPLHKTSSMRPARRIFALLVLFLASAGTVHSASLGPEEAAKHVGERAIVCGSIASSTYAPRSRGEPTFLNLGKPYPDHIFTAVIWGEDRAKFGSPELSLRGKRICVTGEIRFFRGRPEIILREPGQLGQDEM
jgi:hypothetical protein